MNAQIKADSDSDAGRVDISRCKEEVWLLKIPKKIADSWKSQPHDAELGSVKLKYCNDHIELSGIELEPLDPSFPSTCSLTKRSVPYSMFAFSEGKPGRLAIEGKISSQHAMHVEGDGMVPLLRKPKRTSGTIICLSKNNMSSDADNNAIIPNTANKRVVDSRGIADKRVRIASEELLPLIIEAFKRQEKYTFKDLNNEVQQPDSHLKDILKTVCDKTRGEKNREYYTLKPEYKISFNAAADSPNPSQNLGPK
ncbi:general transcription factor IIF subunit 2-like [Schistocerca gregaria]|uniref:general transcription factor IIF subunit 2-like n=1 Tax=Schistocerca gregaria TaxID=7010 RepID=UPI00211F3186|nr:general transcription factor IIF subunit 2-like [Schistocerca gregaria]